MSPQPMPRRRREWYKSLLPGVKFLIAAMAVKSARVRPPLPGLPQQCRIRRRRPSLERVNRSAGRWHVAQYTASPCRCSQMR